MNRSPIIGITTYSRNETGEFLLPGAYVDAVRFAGGTPILLPPGEPNPACLLDALDGLIFAGGGDLNPALYGGEPHHTIYLVDEERDLFELALAKAVLMTEIPVLGICRGMQVLNVATGGNLVTHVPDVYGDRIMHRLDHPRRPIQHPITVVSETRLSAIVGAVDISVVSWHHQAVRQFSPEWQVVAHAADGLVEALEHQHHPWMMAVQWHPELSPQDSAHQQLFQALVKAAA
ncbi:MAG: gamma-glutamyl-gamma-aminobutyrate hydrolase family protein [Elainellaceae cyanobacterium]